MFDRIRQQINPQIPDARCPTKEGEPLSHTSFDDVPGLEDEVAMLSKIPEQTILTIEPKDSSSKIERVSPVDIDAVKYVALSSEMIGDANLAIKDGNGDTDISDNTEDQYENSSMSSDPDWTDDVFTDEITNAMLLHTWREEVMNRLPGEIKERKREEERKEEEVQSTLLIWLQEWPEDVMDVFTENMPSSPPQQPQHNGIIICGPCNPSIHVALGLIRITLSL